MEDFYNYLNDEDLVDDYEAGVTGGVKRATRRVVGEMLGEGPDLPTPSEESLTDLEPSENSQAVESETNSEFSAMLSQDCKFKVFFSVQRRMASARSFNMFTSMLHMRLIN